MIKISRAWCLGELNLLVLSCGVFYPSQVIFTLHWAQSQLFIESVLGFLEAYLS